MTIAPAAEIQRRQEELGQFLTPAPIADFMATMFGELPAAIRLVDPGAGAGALTKAFVKRCCASATRPESIEVTLYEIDPSILGALAATLEECKRWCEDAGIRIMISIKHIDFIQDISARLRTDLFSEPLPTFNVAIANPPYRKIGTDSAERRALSAVRVETSNLYAAFVALVHRLLEPGGQLVAITPRSFCNGPYFRSFREDLLGNLEIHRIHVFESRQAAFREDSVLQENIVIRTTKGRNQPQKVTISSSSGENEAQTAISVLPFTEVVHPRDAERFIHIPSTACHSSAKEALEGLNASLSSLGLTVSSGRVVDFRLKQFLRKNPEAGTVPLIYPCHFAGGKVAWPKLEAKKPNAILESDETRQWLVPTGIYLLTKRFTSKEERRRLVACLFEPDSTRSDWIGFENHLNYFHANGHGLERNLAAGLFAFLNSTVLDQYFRRFSGHTQVNATDLRTLAYPNHDELEAMGREMKSLELSQEEIDELVARHLHGRQ